MTPKVTLALEIMVLNFCCVVLLLYKLIACSWGPWWESDSHLASQRVPTFYANPKIITLFKRSDNWLLSRDRQIHSTSFRPSCKRPIKNMALGVASGGTTFITIFVRIGHLVLKQNRRHRQYGGHISPLFSFYRWKQAKYSVHTPRKTLCLF
jgi:hypothetical protein